MAQYSDREREQLIESGINKDKGDITAREMGAMGGTTVKQAFEVLKEDGKLDDVRVAKNDPAAHGLDRLHEKAGQTSGQEQGGSKAPEAQSNRGHATAGKGNGKH